MTRLPRIALLALTALAAHGADGGSAKAADADAVQAAYDVVMREGKDSRAFLLVFTKSRLALVEGNAPETLIEPVDESAPPDGGAIWVPYTSAPGKGTFEAVLEEAAFSGTIKGDQLTGTILEHGVQVAVTGTRSHRHLRIQKAVDPATTLDQARELKLARKPKEAIELYAKVIENDRFDTMHAAPALVDLVECFQLLKDDAATAKRAKEALERYLSEPPPLDGAHAVALETAEEDLLWKPWPDIAEIPPKPMFAFKLTNAEQKRQMKEGKVSESTVITLDAGAPKRMRFTANSQLSDEKACSATATLADGSAHVATQHWGFSTGDGIRASLTFEDIPAGTKKLAKLEGMVTVSQDQEWELKRIALREGETWDTPEEACKLTGAKEQAGAWTITVVQTKKGAHGGGSSSSSSSSSGGTIDSPIWLSDDHGARMLPRSLSQQGSGATTTSTMVFSVSGKPTTLVHRVVTKTSTRPAPFALTDVELP
jgi:hypothetical protein